MTFRKRHPRPKCLSLLGRLALIVSLWGLKWKGEKPFA